MKESEKKFIDSTYGNWDAPDNYTGGCEKTKIPKICVRYDHEGNIVGYEGDSENQDDACPFYNICEGKRSRYKKY